MRTEMRGWSIDEVARLLTEDPDVPASADAIATRAAADRIGDGDASSTANMRKQMEKQRELQKQRHQELKNRLDPFFRDLDDAESDIETLNSTLRDQQTAELQTADELGKQGPKVKKAMHGIRGNMTI